MKLSAIFDGYPKVLSSGIEMQTSQASNYVVNSEGTALRIPEDLAYVRVRAYGLAPDGTAVRDAAVFQAFEPNDLPVEAELRREITASGRTCHRAGAGSGRRSLRRSGAV